MATIDPRTDEGERIGMSRYCDHLEKRVADLEKAISTIACEAGFGACSGVSQNWYRSLQRIEGVCHGAGYNVLGERIAAQPSAPTVSPTNG